LEGESSGRAEGVAVVIVSAAIRLNGILFQARKPGRHADVIQLMAKQGFRGGEQGFMTDTGEFLNRGAAAEHALKCGQISKISWPPFLYSEDVW
jgi:hypothetical protein